MTSKITAAAAWKYTRLKRVVRNMPPEVREVFLSTPKAEFCSHPLFNQINTTGRYHKFILDDGTHTTLIPSGTELTTKFLSNNFKYDDGDLYYGGQLVERLQTMGYRYMTMGGKNYLAHRIIWMMHNGPIQKGMVIDHIDGCRTNNKIENLRCITRQQNQWNASTARQSTSGLKYIGTIISRGKKYYRVQFHSPFNHIKTFTYSDEGLETAIAYRNAWVEKHHGEMANVSAYDGSADTGEKYIFWADPDHNYYFVNVKNRTKICTSMEKAKIVRDKFLLELA